MISKLTLDSLFLILLLAAYSKGGDAATVHCPGIRRGDGTCCYPTICPRDQQYRLCKDRTAVSRDTCEKCSEGMINPISVDTRNSTYSDYEYDMCFTPQCDCALGAILTNEYDCLKNGKKRKCICDLQNGYWGDPNICQSVDESLLKRIQKPGVELTQSGQIMPCKNGTFKEKGDNSVCRPHTKCKSGEELKTPGTTTSDSVCHQSPVNNITLPESTAESSVPVYPLTNETESHPGEVDPSNHINIYVSISLIIITLVVLITAIVVWRLSKKGKLHITCIRRLLGIHQNLNFPLPDHRDFSTSRQNTGLSSDTEYDTARSEFSFQADTQEHPPNGRDHENAPLLVNRSVDEHDATGETSAKTVSENVRIEIENITDPENRTPQVSHPAWVSQQDTSSRAIKLPPSGDEISKHNLMEDTHLISLRNSFYDIIVLCADNDRMEAAKYRDHLKNDMILEHGIRIKVALCKRAVTKCLPAGHKIKSYREDFERCNFVFVYLTKSFCESELCSVLTEVCLMQDDKRKKWQVVLIHTVKKSQADFQIPMALNAERGLNYFDNDLYYRREVEKLICSRLHIRLQHEGREFSEQYKPKCEHDQELKEPLLIQENGKVVEEEESYKCEQVKDRGGSAGVSSHCHLSNVSEDRARQSTPLLQSNSSRKLRIDSLLRSSGSLDNNSGTLDNISGTLDHSSGSIVHSKDSLDHCRDSNVHTQDTASQTADMNQPHQKREMQQENITIIHNHIYNQPIMPNKANIIIGNNNNMILPSVDGCSNGDDGCNENEENNYNEEDNQRNSTDRSQVHSDDKSVECESLSSDSTGDQIVDGSIVATTTNAWADCVRGESLMSLDTSNRTDDQEESEVGHATSVKKVDSTRSTS